MPEQVPKGDPPVTPPPQDPKGDVPKITPHESAADAQILEAKPEFRFEALSQLPIKISLADKDGRFLQEITLQPRHLTNCETLGITGIGDLIGITFKDGFVQATALNVNPNPEAYKLGEFYLMLSSDGVLSVYKADAQPFLAILERNVTLQYEVSSKTEAPATKPERSESSIERSEAIISGIVRAIISCEVTTVESIEETESLSSSPIIRRGFTYQGGFGPRKKSEIHMFPDSTGVRVSGSDLPFSKNPGAIKKLIRSIREAGTTKYEGSLLVALQRYETHLGPKKLGVFKAKKGPTWGGLAGFYPSDPTAQLIVILQGKFTKNAEELSTSHSQHLLNDIIYIEIGNGIDIGYPINRTLSPDELSREIEGIIAKHGVSFLLEKIFDFKSKGIELSTSADTQEIRNLALLKPVDTNYPVIREEMPSLKTIHRAEP